LEYLSRDVPRSKRTLIDEVDTREPVDEMEPRGVDVAVW
jgi:hypothetical protein